MRTVLAALAIVLLSACGSAGERTADATRDASRETSMRETAARDAAADSAFADSVIRFSEDMGATVTESSSRNSAPVRNSDEIRTTLRAYAGETYIGELLAERDSMNFRWPDRTRDPLRVWIQPSTLAHFTPAHLGIVRDAFDPWMSTGIPVAIDFVEDSSRAEMLVTWVERYESRTTGRTRWVRDQHGWITGAGIELALAQPDGRPLEPAALGAIARHEIGHLLGLTHTADESNIMSARVRIAELSEADRNTVRLVYKLPPGSLRTP